MDDTAHGIRLANDNMRPPAPVLSDDEEVGDKSDGDANSSDHWRARVATPGPSSNRKRVRPPSITSTSARKGKSSFRGTIALKESSTALGEANVRGMEVPLTA